jgi:hypothetical protein
VPEWKFILHNVLYILLLVTFFILSKKGNQKLQRVIWLMDNKLFYEMLEIYKQKQDTVAYTVNNIYIKV